MNDSVRRPAAALAASAVLLASCSQGLFDADRSTYRVAPERLERIATEDPSLGSRTPPVQVEDAIARALERRDPTPVWPDRMDIDLAQVREATLRNNLDLRTQLVEPAIARRTIDAERAKFEASIVARYENNSSNLFGDPPFGGISDGGTGELGINVPLATGGAIGFSTTASRFDSANPATFDGAGDWAAGLGFSISQPLLRNAGVDVNTASIRIAEQNGQSVSARTKLEVLRILAEADRSYWRLYAAYRELEVRTQQFELAVAQLERARRRVVAGDAAEIEVTRAESGVGATVENVILAGAAVRERVRRLKQTMNRPDLPIESETLLVPKTDPNPVGLDLDPHELADRAVANRMEMLELEIELATRSIEIAFARNQALPVFALDFNYAPVGRGSSFGNAVRNWGDFEEDSYALALRGEIPIGNEAALNRLARVVLERVQRLATRDARRQAIRTETFDAVENLTTAWQRIVAARLETVLAARTYQAEQRQFDVGVRTSQDVLDANSRLADAQSREVLALAQYQIALIDIAFATGTLAGMAGARWEPIDVPELENRFWGEAERDATRQGRWVPSGNSAIVPPRP